MIEQIRNNKGYRLRVMIKATLYINVLYAISNFLLGLFDKSIWFAMMGVYFLVLSIMRIGCVYMLQKEPKTNHEVLSFAGGMLLVLCASLIGTIILSDRLDVIEPVHKIIMLAIATYTTVKTVLAILNAVRAYKARSDAWTALRNIGCADAAASVLSMQRSMLVSFGEMTTVSIKMMNALTGAGVCIIILVLALSMLYSARRQL